MSDKRKPTVAIITLIQEGAVKIGGEHAMLFPYVEQVLKAADTLKEQVEVIPYVITPRPKKLEQLARVEELKAKMAVTNDGKMILVSNGATGPYANPWNWEKFGHEANKVMIKIVKERKVDGLIVMAHGFASIPVVLDLKASEDNGAYGKVPIASYYITHSSFDEHKDNRPQRRILEREIQNHAQMIAISPYMAEHLADIAMVDTSDETIPLYNALPKQGWFSTKVASSVILDMIAERNEKLNKSPFFGSLLPLEEILDGKKELVLYFGRAQKYVKGTDAVIATARNDPKRHYMLICSGSQDELVWHKKMLEGTTNVTLAWEHNSKLVLGMVQLTEHYPDARIYSVFLSRREPMGLVSREVVLMQDKGSVLPIVSDGCGFDDIWQREFSFIVTNPCYCEDDSEVVLNKNNLSAENEIFVHDECITSTLQALDKMTNLSIKELQTKVESYKQAIIENYSQDRYWAFYLLTIGKVLPKLEKLIQAKLKENKLMDIPNV